MNGELGVMMAWLFLIVVCGIAALVSLDSYFLKIAKKQYMVMLPIKIRRHFFKAYTKGFWNWGEHFIKNAWNWFKKKLKLWIKTPFLPFVILVFIATFGTFGFLFYNNLYPLIKSLYGLIPEDEFGDIKVDDDGFRNISLLIAGSATFAFAVLGMFLSVIRNILTRHQNNISQQAQITESMGRAIEQIGAFNDGKPNIVVRLGGLYSLQFIMQESPRHAAVIAKIFSTYVRENAKKDKESE